MTDLITLMGKPGFQTRCGDLVEQLAWACFQAAISIWCVSAFFVNHVGLLLTTPLSFPPSSLSSLFLLKNPHASFRNLLSSSHLPCVTKPCLASKPQLGIPGHIGPCLARPLESQDCPLSGGHCMLRLLEGICFGLFYVISGRSAASCVVSSQSETAAHSAWRPPTVRLDGTVASPHDL